MNKDSRIKETGGRTFKYRVTLNPGTKFSRSVRFVRYADALGFCTQLDAERDANVVAFLATVAK